MVRWIRSAVPRDGREREAEAWAIKVTDFANRLDPPAPVQVCLPKFGPDVQRYRWMADFASTGEWEEWWSRFVAAFWKDSELSSEFVEAIDVGSIHNEVWSILH